MCDVRCDGDGFFSVRLTPPLMVQVMQSELGVNITWDSGYGDHRYVKGRLDYELSLQDQSSKGKVTEPLRSESHGENPSR